MTTVLVTSPEERAVQDEVVEVLDGLGWEKRGPDEMNALREGRMGEAIVEPLLVEAIERVNGVPRDEAEHVASLVRRMTSDREFIGALRDGVNVKLRPDEPSRDIYLLDLYEPERNSYVVSWEFSLRTGAVREPRLDVVTLVNGLPLGLIENKAPDHELAEAARDWAVYWEDAPQLAALGAVIGINNGIRFRVGPSRLEAVQDYAEWKDTWPHPKPDDPDEMTLALTGAYHPATLVDLAAHFVIFETREGPTKKKLARYQQFRGANKIVERVLSGGDRGVVWHWAGSGKSLTMVFAARKLVSSGLDRPTVFIVIDRVDLDDQISGTFGACEFDGLVNITSGKELRRLIEGDRRGVIVTIVNKFKSVKDAVSERDNVIVFVDEAHRSQEGEFGIWMRAALPNARLFGFTGTPVEADDRSTRRAFSPVVQTRDDGVEAFENYLDAYSIKQSIEDGATVSVLYEPRLDDWRIEDADLDEMFEREFGDLPEEQQEPLRRDAARDAVVAKTPRRIEAIAADVIELLRRKVAANGFKAQLVAVDRAACAAYAEEFGKHLRRDEFAVVISRDAKKDGAELRRWWPQASLQRLEGAKVEVESGAAEDERPEVEAGHRAAVRKLIDGFKDPEDPLKLLIVNSMLLTGFDAPVEQALFLDRGLRRHTLLQAIARTNRPHPGKEHGIVFDYWGVFEDLDAALREFSPEDVQQAVTSTGRLADRFPEAIAEALAYVKDVPGGVSERRRMVWLVDHFARNPEIAARFEEAYATVRAIYETLAPDPRLAPHLEDYRGLVKIRAVWKHGAREDAFDITPHQAKTHALVQDAITEAKLREDLPVFRVDGSYLERLDEAGLTGEEKATEIEAAVIHEIKVRGEHDPVARSLAERLRALRERRRQQQEMTLELLEEYEDLARDYVEEVEAAGARGLTPRAHSLTVLARAHASETKEEVLAEVARRVDSRLREIIDFEGWEERPDVLQEIRKTIIAELVRDEQTRTLATSPYVEEAVTALVAEAKQ
jgi:type I restriction enzyme R subunit